MKRVVVKIGSTVVIKRQGGIALKCLQSLARDIVSLHKKGWELIIVTSGAIGMGKEILKIKIARSLSEKQALAALGQARLMHTYETLFSRHRCQVAQVLLTRQDLQERSRYLNARNTLFALLEKKIIPIINENDTVAVEEIKFGDNDTLSAHIAVKLEADLLIILSDVRGLYSGLPGQKGARLIKEVKGVTAALEKMAIQTKELRGVGGMFTKLQAAKIVNAAGIAMIIARGDIPGIIADIVKGKKIGTYFLPREKKLSGRKGWIAFSAKVCGKIIVDEGAKRALVEKNKSLLPSGILGIDGEFKAGDVVGIFDGEGKEFARGLAYYSSQEISKIAGRKTAEILSVLGHKDYDEIIHRDNLALV